MKVIDNALRPYSISELGEGVTFKFCGQYFIKLSCELKDESDTYNAVRLTDGMPCTFNETDEIMPFNCELIVL